MFFFVKSLAPIAGQAIAGAGNFYSPLWDPVTEQSVRSENAAWLGGNDGKLELLEL
jgi:hypothetical protein